jgi:Type VI secretion system VasI, EvfG, VC_A0118
MRPWLIRFAVSAASIIGVMYGSVVGADESKGVAHCATIESPVDRLQCFDDWAHTQGYAGPGLAPAPESAGNWDVKRGKNPFDDTEIVQLQLESDSGHSRFGNKPYFLIRCRSERMYVAIWWHDFLGEDEIEVKTRIDKHRVETALWQISNMHDAIIHMNAKAIAFIKRCLALRSWSRRFSHILIQEG